VNQHVAGAGDGRRAPCDIVDRRAYGGRRAFREHPRNSSRRGDISRKTLHENCPYRRWLHAVGETIDGFGFRTRPTAHVRAIED